jgi:hypothetical protein
MYLGTTPPDSLLVATEVINLGSAVPESDLVNHARVLQDLIRRQRDEVWAYLYRHSSSPELFPERYMNWRWFYRQIADISVRPGGLDLAC